MDLHALPPGEKNRVLTTLQQDRQYIKSRYTLLGVSLICAIGVAIAGMMLINDLLTIQAASVVIGICVIVYFVSIFRAVSGRKAALSRAMYAQTGKTQSKKKVKKKGRRDKTA